MNKNIIGYKLYYSLLIYQLLYLDIIVVCVDVLYLYVLTIRHMM